MRHKYLLITGIVLLSACKKDQEEAPLEVSGEYQTGTTLHAAPIELYTRAGLVNNAQVVDAFIQRNSIRTPYFFSRTDVPLGGTTPSRLSINASGQAKLIAPGQPGADTLRAQVISQQPDRLVLAGPDSTSRIVSLPLNRCDFLEEKVQLVVPAKRTRDFSSSTGYGRSTRYLPIKVIGIRNRQLYIPFLSWAVKHTGTQTGTCMTAAFGSWNFFDPAILSQLTTGDTIVVQRREISLHKQ
ncbi:hypothetical protein GCM10023185_45350 [Hymenobacter saemangeumensis]|uniref:Polysaccharide export protein n=1 Tax=Hymenobacter saemangeumensis TaxID=1084522 RepID=A0ABP8ISW0_9BACT